MTEKQWLNATAPYTLLNATHTEVLVQRTKTAFGVETEVRVVSTPVITFTARKMSLFGVACCRRFRPSLSPVFLGVLSQVEWQVDNCETSVAFVELLEMLSKELRQLYPSHRDGDQQEIDSEVNNVVDVANFDIRPKDFGADLSHTLAGARADIATNFAEEETWSSCADAAHKAEQLAQSVLLREIIGNPFRRVHLDPFWQTSTVGLIAQAVYEESAFDRLPILADALEDAGCDNAEIIGHCRSEGPHVRGCWVIDLLLGKS